MSISESIQHEEIDNLYLDPMNPRLGRNQTGRDVTQAEVLELMRDWSLEELAGSFLESGFWRQEALVAVKEELYGQERLVVVEGNRRLAALRYLADAFQGCPASRQWKELVDGQDPRDLFSAVPFFLADSRVEVEAFLGFRHVTGIKEWKPAEKAEYIAKLVGSGMSYRQVMRKMGSKTSTVRQNYIAYQLLLQMESQEGISIERVEDKFSVLYLSLRAGGVQSYLGLDIQAEPDVAQQPVPNDRLENLINFAAWLFGNDERDPVVHDSRQVDDFGFILQSPAAVEYMERNPNARFDVAFQLAGGVEREVIRLVNLAADNIELSLGSIHRHRESAEVQRAVQRCAGDVVQLLRVFPRIREEVLPQEA